MITTRYFDYNGTPVLEQMNWIEVNNDDKRAQDIGGLPHIFSSAINAVFDASQATGASKVSVKQPDGSSTGFIVYPEDSSYWNPLSLPILEGYKEISKEQYNKMTLEMEAIKEQFLKDRAAKSQEKAKALAEQKAVAFAELVSKGYSETTAKLMLGI